MNKFLRGVGSWFQGVGGVISSLGNAISNGDGDTTISAFVGYRETNDPTKGYDFLRRVIDTTFRPVDGVHHCRRSFEADPNELFHRGWNVVRCPLAFVACVILIIPFYLAGAVISIIRKSSQDDG